MISTILTFRDREEARIVLRYNKGSTFILECSVSEDVESNITYTWAGQRGYDNEDYIFIGPERVAVRNSRTPFFFVQPSKEN